MAGRPLETVALDDAKRLADLYDRLQLRLLTAVAERLDDPSDLDADTWAARKLTELSTLITGVRAAIAEAAAEGAEEIDRALLGAYAAGNTEAAGALAALNVNVATAATTAPLAPTLAAQNRLKEAAALVDRGAQRHVAQAYRTVIAETLAAVTGTVTRREAAQVALDRLAQQGILSVRDADGRLWRASSYVEMAARTELAHAHTQGALDRYRAAGHELVVVSITPSSCPDCAEWSGQILSVDGGHPDYPSLDDARDEGFQHPNCTCSIGAYVEGLTRLREAPDRSDAYEARQKLRYHERQVRAAKERLAVAQTPAAKTQAKALLAGRSARLRNHVSTTGAKRQRNREGLRAR